MNVLVTGGAGFIGSSFVRLLLETDEYHVTTLDSLTYAGTKENLTGVLGHPQHEFVEGDIRNQSLVADLVSDADAIVNFAAESHVDRSIESAAPFVDTNIDGTRTLLEAARDTNVERFVQISTDEVYGEIEEGLFHESDPLNPRNPYAATKAGADLLAQSYAETYDVPVLITRSSNNFGPRQHPEKLIPKLIHRASQGKNLPIYGDGTNVREWLYVEDNCRAIHRVLEDGTIGEIYNIGSGEEMENVAVARAVLEELDKSEDLIEFVSDRPGHDQRYALDTTKIRDLGWDHDWSFQDGLRETVSFYC